MFHRGVQSRRSPREPATWTRTTTSTTRRRGHRPASLRGCGPRRSPLQAGNLQIWGSKPNQNVQLAAGYGSAYASGPRCPTSPKQDSTASWWSAPLKLVRVPKLGTTEGRAVFFDFLCGLYFPPRMPAGRCDDGHQVRLFALCEKFFLVLSAVSVVLLLAWRVDGHSAWTVLGPAPAGPAILESGPRTSETVTTGRFLTPYISQKTQNSVFLANLVQYFTFWYLFNSTVFRSHFGSSISSGGTLAGNYLLTRHRVNHVAFLPPGV